MRYSSVTLAAALTAMCLSASLSAQRADDQIDPRSMQLLAQGKALKAGGDIEGATDVVETALAVDPRNRAAFIVLAELAESRGLPGKSIRLYREALLLEPNDVAALRGQGEALVAKGAIAQARSNLSRIKTLCKGVCPDATRLSAAIAKGPPVTTAAVAPKTVSE
jgi:Tfp pilus assembly protein PilF